MSIKIHLLDFSPKCVILLRWKFLLELYYRLDYTEGADKETKESASHPDHSIYSVPLW